MTRNYKNALIADIRNNNVIHYSGFVSEHGDEYVAWQYETDFGTYWSVGILSNRMAWLNSKVNYYTNKADALEGLQELIEQAKNALIADNGWRDA